MKTISKDDVSEHEQIGKGSFGVVKKAKIRGRDGCFAVKSVFLDQSTFHTSGIPSYIVSEVALLGKLSKLEGIILFFGAFDDVVFNGERIVEVVKLVFEFMDTDLRHYMRQRTRGLSQYVVRNFLFQLLKGVNSCHSLGVLHRDLKPDNILINIKDEALKITDIGIGRMFPDLEEECTPRQVTRYYRAPELLLGSTHYHSPVDMWSVGCIFAEMLKRVVLFRGKEGDTHDEADMLQLDEIFRKHGRPCENDWPNLASMKGWKHYKRWKGEAHSTPGERWDSSLGRKEKDLLSKMLAYNPAKRISAVEALAHPYFEGFVRGHTKNS